MARSVSLGVEPLSIIDLSYAIGRRLWLMAASLARSTTALAESGTTTMASPALTVKAEAANGARVYWSVNVRRRGCSYSCGGRGSGEAQEGAGAEMCFHLCAC